jgi:hypothetical protein
VLGYANNDRQYASESTSSPSSDTLPTEISIATDRDDKEEAVFYDYKTGELLRDIDAKVTRIVLDPLPTGEKKSVALEVNYRGETRWMYLSWSPGSARAGYDLAAGGGSFDVWLAKLDPGSLQYNVANATPASQG